MSGLLYPKPARGTALLERRERAAQRRGFDRAENRKVKARSGGRCEVLFAPDGRHHDDPRCNFRASHVHHMIGGWGKRARGISILAKHKQHVCAPCHQEITGELGGKKLIRVGGTVPRWTDYYRRKG